MLELTNRQKDILQASTELISAGGIQNFTTKSLAAKLEISEPALYRHFKNKLEILYTILLELKNENSIVSKSTDNVSINQIGLMFQKQAEQFCKNPAKAAIIFSEEIFQNDKTLSDLVLSIMNDKNKMITSIINYEQKNGIIRNDIPATQLTFIIMGTFRLIVSKWRLSNFNFNLKKEMNDTWLSIEKMLKV